MWLTLFPRPRKGVRALFSHHLKGLLRHRVRHSVLRPRAREKSLVKSARAIYLQMKLCKFNLAPPGVAPLVKGLRDCDFSDQHQDGSEWRLTNARRRPQREIWTHHYLLDGNGCVVKRGERSERGGSARQAKRAQTTWPASKTHAD